MSNEYQQARALGATQGLLGRCRPCSFDAVRIHGLIDLLKALFRRRSKLRLHLTVPDVPLKHLYLFFDESGNLDFGPNGTRYFLCGVLAVRDPWPLMDELSNLRQQLFRGSLIPACFHAAEDRQAVRNRVFDVIANVGGFKFFAGLSKKVDVPAKYRDAARFYTVMADFTLRMALQHYPTAEPVYLITDYLPTRGKREAVVKGFKACLSTVLDGREYRIEHQSASAQGCIQVADYVNWALFKKWERGDQRSYDLIRNFVEHETHMDWSPQG